VSDLKESGKGAFLPTDEEMERIANEAHHSLCIVLLFQIFSIFNYKKSNRFEL
jgi:hypothetical protein